MIPKYEPKPIYEQFEVGECKIELNRLVRVVTVNVDSDVISIPYDSIPDLVQFLAWAMRERMEVTADAEADEVRESSCYPEWGEV